MKTHRKTSIFLWNHHSAWGAVVQDTIISTTGLLLQRLTCSFFPMLQIFNWGPKKLNYPYKGKKNALQSCEQMPRMSQMPAISSTPVSWKPMCCWIYLGCRRHQELPDLTRKNLPSLTDLEVTAGSLQPPYTSSFQNSSSLKNQNCAIKWTDTLSPLKHIFLLLFSHLGQAKHPW